jgi:hypothetical protein
MRFVLCLTVALSLFGGEVWAEEKEPTAIVELGAAGEWDFPSGKFGPTAAVEFSPIKDWLEIEAGVSTMFSGRQTVPATRRIEGAKGKFASRECTPFIPIKRQQFTSLIRQDSGAPIFYSKSRSLYQTKWNSCSVPDPNGRSRATEQKFPPRLRRISCFGQRRIESSAGFWSRPIATHLAQIMNNRLARAWACLSLFHKQNVHIVQ